MQEWTLGEALHTPCHTMPALMLTTMPPLSPFTSALPNHVLEDHHLTLHLLAHALAQERTTHARP